jgi:hypothetical protein
MSWLDIIAAVLVFAAGYVASIYTWPWIRTTVTGAEAEIERLRTRLDSVSAWRGHQ